LHEDDLCVLRIARAGAIGAEVLRFEGENFESVLRQAADAGALKAVCLEKQIAFLSRSLATGAPVPPADEVRATSAEQNLAIEVLFLHMTQAISALVHETQRERGTASLFLASRGKLFADEFHGQWRATDARRAELLLFRRQQAFALPVVLAQKLEKSEQLLGELLAGRASVEGLELGPAQAIERYSKTNAALLSVIDGLAQKGVDTASRPTALAWMALLHAKEKTGIERAQLASAFVWDRYADGQHATVTGLIAASDSYLHVFSAAAPRGASEFLRKQLRSEVARAVTEMERVALLRHDGGFGIDPMTWFASISRKMDMLADVESTIRASLSPSA
jgi:methyl-accepting chemotaxis protein